MAKGGRPGPKARGRDGARNLSHFRYVHNGEVGGPGMPCAAQKGVTHKGGSAAQA